MTKLTYDEWEKWFIDTQCSVTEEEIESMKTQYYNGLNTYEEFKHLLKYEYGHYCEMEGRKMTDKERAQKIWEAFCGELIQEPTDDMKEALATAITELASQLQYGNTDWQTLNEQMIMDVERVMLVVNELEGK